MTWPFYVCAAVAIVATWRVISNTNAVHAMLALIASFLAVAGMFFCIGAPFAAAMEIIIYAGAILVLFVFVVMMMNIGTRSSDEEKKWLSSSAWAFPVTASAVLLVVMVVMTTETQTARDMGTQNVGAKDVGMALFSQYILIVEMGSMLLLGALVAAYHLGKKKIAGSSDQRDTRRDK